MASVARRCRSLLRESSLFNLDAPNVGNLRSTVLLVLDCTSVLPFPAWVACWTPLLGVILIAAAWWLYLHESRYCQPSGLCPPFGSSSIGKTVDASGPPAVGGIVVCRVKDGTHYPLACRLTVGQTAPAKPPGHSSACLFGKMISKHMKASWKEELP